MVAVVAHVTQVEGDHVVSSLHSERSQEEGQVAVL